MLVLKIGIIFAIVGAYNVLGSPTPSPRKRNKPILPSIHGFQTTTPRGPKVSPKYQTTTETLSTTRFEENWSTADSTLTTDIPTISTDTLTGSSEELTTTSTDEPTTTFPVITTTELPSICNSSLNTKDDLKVIIKYLLDGNNVVANIVDNFNGTTIPEKYLEDIHYFRQWFRERPEHLKHILEDISTAGRTLKPHAMMILNTMTKEMPLLMENMNEKTELSNKIIAEFEKQQKICDLTCYHELFDRVKYDNTPVEYYKNQSYCGSITHIHEEISTRLTDFSVNMLNNYKEKLAQDDENFSKQIDEIKNKLKDAALNKFGRTMYDILNIQDEYYHLDKDMRNFQVEGLINSIKNNINHINGKLNMLPYATRELAKYCRRCNDVFVSRQQLYDPHISDDIEQPQEENLLQAMINEALLKAEEDIELTYSKMFETLIMSIAEAEAATPYIEDLEVINEEINQATKFEAAQLQSLKEYVTDIKMNISVLYQLQEISLQLSEALDEKLSFINNYISSNF